MAKINELLAVVSSGARRNKYRVLIPVTDDSNLSRNMDILCHSASIPGRALTPVDVIVKGRKAQLVGETSLESTWEAIFYNTTNMEVRDYFLDWMEDMHSLKTPDDDNGGGVLGLDNLNKIVKAGRGIAADATAALDQINGLIDDPINALFGDPSYTPEYQREITIQQLGSGNSNDTYQVNLIGAFPINIATVEFDDSTAEISTTTVTFAYSDIIVGTIPKRSNAQILLGDSVGGLF